MKKIKLILLFFVLLFLFVLTARYIVRKPSFTIQTSGKLYIVNKGSRDITVFDLFNGKVINEIPIEVESHNATTLLTQNRVIVTNYGTTEIKGKSLTVIDTKNNKVEKTIEFAAGYLGLDGIVAIPKSNKVAVVSSISNELLVINLDTETVEKKIATQQKMSHLVVLHPFKPLAYVTNINSGSVSVIDLELEKVIKIIHCKIGIHAIDITPDASEIWVTNNKENTISVINTGTYQITNTLSTGKEPLRLKFSIDGKHCLVTNAGDGTISVYGQHAKKQIKTIQLHGKATLLERILYHTPHPVGILIHPNGLYAFVANSNANKIEVIDMKSFSVVSTIGTGKIPDGLAFVK